MIKGAMRRKRCLVKGWHDVGFSCWARIIYTRCEATNWPLIQHISTCTHVQHNAIPSYRIVFNIFFCVQSIRKRQNCPFSLILHFVKEVEKLSMFSPISFHFKEEKITACDSWVHKKGYFYCNFEMWCM